VSQKSQVLVVNETGRQQSECCLANEDCSGPLQRDHVAYYSVTQPDVFQLLCRYHNITEVMELRFFVAKRVVGGRLPGRVRIRLNGWHIRHRLHPDFKRRIHKLSERYPLSDKFIPGQGQMSADKALAEGRKIPFVWKPYLRDANILGFWLRFDGQKRAKLVR
jgi:hypothetical protein